jgi:hypothetical protein
VNYGQRENAAIYQARALPEFASFSDRVAALAEHIDPIPCEVVYTTPR